MTGGNQHFLIEENIVPFYLRLGCQFQYQWYNDLPTKQSGNGCQKDSHQY